MMNKICFVKQSYILNLPWKSVRFRNPKQMAESFVYRSQNLEFIIAKKADVWVAEGQSVVCAGAAKDPEGLSAMRRAHETVPWSAIPWGEYDAVFSHDPIIPDKITRRHPRILWFYNEPEHRTARARKASQGILSGAYDLFWDDYMRAGPKLKRLPQAVGFPYPRNPDIMRELVKPTNEPAVFLDSRHVHEVAPGKRGPMLADFEAICGLPVRYAYTDVQTEQGKSMRRLLPTGKMMRCLDYLKLVGSCKYYLVFREKRINGQAAAEAAALGLIVVANSNGVYHEILCHPKCTIPPGGPARLGLRVIQGIEKDPDLQKEILDYQDRKLREKFWKEPLGILGAALEMKRGMK
jgi:hypothetical protein